MLFRYLTWRSLEKRQSRLAFFMSATALGLAAFLSTVRVRGLTVFGRASALRKKRLAAAASRLALSRKSMVWPRLSVQVHPLAFDLQIGLVAPPRAGGRAQMGPHPLLQLRRVGLDPAV